MAKVNAFKAIIKMTEQEYSYKHSKEKNIASIFPITAPTTLVPGQNPP